jgi:uroporphyrin-III C-methyltransferase/precorrin-2 dehydrogenase/sirohydrochlorin ferrochelatase/precorrin-2 dehydrogenase/sirohydrochlorin ferrochelatase
MVYFPMMINLNERPCLVVGGGMVAFRKVRVLRDFGAKVTVTALSVCKEIEEISDIHISRKKFERDDVKGMVLVVAATDNHEENRAISRLCRAEGIPVNAVDEPQDCDFIFPSYRKEGDVVAAFSSGGNSPVLTQYLKEQNKTIVTKRIGEIADLLGDIREDVKRMIPVEKMRKNVYNEVLSELLQADELPTGEILTEKIMEEWNGKRG